MSVCGSPRCEQGYLCPTCRSSLATPDITQTIEHFSKLAERFHAHLDVCPQCKHQPHNLCATGASLLKSAGE